MLRKFEFFILDDTYDLILTRLGEEWEVFIRSEQMTSS
jgi:hypothetical protein